MNSMQFEFNAVCEHLIRQGRQSMSDSRDCLYRDEYGNSCAVGCRIPDKFYRLDMEGKLVAGLIAEGYELPSEIIEYSDLFRSLQNVHDDDSNWRNMSILKESLQNVANRYNLEYPACIA